MLVGRNALSRSPFARSPLTAMLLQPLNQSLAVRSLKNTLKVAMFVACSSPLGMGMVSGASGKATNDTTSN